MQCDWRTFDNLKCARVLAPIDRYKWCLLSENWWTTLVVFFSSQFFFLGDWLLAFHCAHDKHAIGEVNKKTYCQKKWLENFLYMNNTVFFIDELAINCTIKNENMRKRINFMFVFPAQGSSRFVFLVSFFMLDCFVEHILFGCCCYCLRWIGSEIMV